MEGLECLTPTRGCRVAKSENLDLSEIHKLRAHSEYIVFEVVIGRGHDGELQRSAKCCRGGHLDQTVQLPLLDRVMKRAAESVPRRLMDR